MRSPHSRRIGLLLLLLAALDIRPACAAPPTPASHPALAPKPAASAPAAIPDYGGRDSGPSAPDAGAPDPVGQAGRALSALVIVLIGVVGVVYALKRFGLVTPGAVGKPARIAFALPGQAAPSLSPITVLSSQTLPGGAMLHVVSVSGRTLVLAATPHTVTAVAEWEGDGSEADEAAGFEDYLAHAEPGGNSGVSAANDRLRSLLARPRPAHQPERLDETR